MLLTPWVNFCYTQIMPGRKVPLVKNEIYHILNKGISLQTTFLTKRDYDRALQTTFYYQNQKPPVKYSRFLSLSNKQRLLILEKLKSEGLFLVEIIAFCLMPNHFHFLLKQITAGGISKFIGNFTNSYTRYFNTKNKREGALFKGKFKAVRIESDEQLLHVSRYIHLNPYSSYVIKTLEELENYPYSSLPEYLQKSPNSLCQKEIILDQFKNLNSYKNFVFDQANYQRELENIKHLILEE